MGVRLPLLPLRSGVVESVRRATVTRERQVRALPPEPAPVVEEAMTPGPQPGGCGFESRRGCLNDRLLAVGEHGHPAGFGRRRSQVRVLPARLAFGGVAQTARALACQARGRRFESGRPRFRGGRGVDGSTRGRDPRRRRFEPGRPPSPRADAEHRRAQQAVTLSPRAVVVRLHPSAPSGGCSSIGRAPRLQRGGCRFDSDHLHCLRSVNGKHAPFVRPRCGFDSCRRLLSYGRWFDSSRAYHLRT